MAELTDLPVQFRGSALARRILKLMGWQVHFRGLPAQHGVIVVYPHTSNWDFPVGLLAKWATGLEAKFLGKHTLFRIPLFGPWLRWLGGVPVDRRASGGVVEQMVEMFARKQQAGEYFWLALTPEGTRSAQVPLVMAVLDYGRKEVRLVDVMTLSGQVDEDMRRIAQVFEGCRGFREELAAPIRLEVGKERQ